MAQRGDELLVYSVKGDVKAVYKNVESPVKIGKVLRQGTTILAGKSSALTMVCHQGKPISILQEGVYPLSLWKDSCKTDQRSVTARYFKYIWSEFYYRSAEYREEILKSNAAVSRGDATFRYEVYPDDTVFARFPRGLDTVRYVSGDFPLSWECYGCKGKFQFLVYTAKERKLVYKDSVVNSQVGIEQFKRVLKPGTRYAWTIRTDARTGVIRRRILEVVPAADFKHWVDSLEMALDMPEDSAARYFRTGFFLEQKHFLADAYRYYKMAAEKEPSIALYWDKLTAFRFEYRIPSGDPGKE